MLVRVGAYILSGFAVWYFLQADPSPVKHMLPPKPLALDAERGMIFGVCAGISNYTGFDVTLIRLIWSLAVIYRGAGIGLYLLAFLLMPAA
ncbi:MAG: PspC domain-containing protein [Negativicutes bacterium]|nr:PspC domain-containing protein [Negativicutes bacterium]